EVEKDCTAEQVLELLAEKFPKAAPILKSTRLANEDEYVGKQTLLTDGAEYCLIPPVSGG
ncbi:MAG: MoaD/ThiS family protein, partial [Deltaproteobacteria bacterium]|nr:MoaD/ThiS family protein [Deltaproteobacteria bacterium]